MVFKNICILLLWRNVALALEVLTVFTGYSIYLWSHWRRTLTLSCLALQVLSGPMIFVKITLKFKNILRQIVCWVLISISPSHIFHKLAKIIVIYYLALTGLTRSCLEMNLTSVVWTYHTFENNFGLKHKFAKYL